MGGDPVTVVSESHRNSVRLMVLFVFQEVGTVKKLCSRFLIVVFVAMLGAACDNCPTGPWVKPPVFSEDFEASLVKWEGRPQPRHHYAQIVDDPLRSGNSVVNFTQTVAAGDLFTLPIPVDVTKEYKLTFEYLGIPSAGSLPGNLGGFLGVGDGIPGDHYWLFGPMMNEAEHELDLIDDGQWHSYEVIFVPSQLIAAPEGEIRIMIEDGEGFGSLPEDAYFDKIRLYEKRDSDSL